MKERPILMSGPLVAASLCGEKTETRRLVKQLVGGKYPQYDHREWDGHMLRVHNGEGAGWSEPCPFGTPGDRLWVRENIRTCRADGGIVVHYQADDAERTVPDVEGYTVSGGRWTPSIHMPRWAARLFLEVTEVRVERLQDMHAGNVYEEGFRSSTLAKPRTGPLTWESAYGIWHNDDYDAFCGHEEKAALEAFADLWGSLAPAGSKWADSPWVWVVSFRRVTP
jgi:hypothetical protein